MLEFPVRLAKGESSRRWGSDGLVKTSWEEFWIASLEFRFHPRGTGKVVSDFKEVTLWGAGGNASNIEGPPGSR